MNWDNLSNKKKANFLVLGVTISLFLLFLLSMVFLNNKNSILSQQLIKEYALSNSLTILQKSENFPVLSTVQAKNIIRQVYRKTRGKKIHIDKNKRIVFTGLKMPFFALLNGLSILKNKHGIIVIIADIKYNKSGVVDATMTFAYP